MALHPIPCVPGYSQLRINVSKEDRHRMNNSALEIDTVEVIFFGEVDDSVHKGGAILRTSDIGGIEQ
jgi:hypothetical protein